MSGRIFDGRIAEGIAPDDRARQERLKATARALVTAVRDGLVRDGFVRLHGFGTFRLRPVAARRGRHPRTGEPIDIPAGWRVIFRPAKALRERIEPDRAPALPIGEPHASREAMLAASAADAAKNIGRGAGRIPAEGIAAAPPTGAERAAAAAMSERKFTVHGPVPGGPADPESDSRVTRSPAALSGVPAADEASPAEGARTTGSAPSEPSAAPVTARRQNGSRYALVLLLLLLVAGLGWLFRPVDLPAPRVVEESEPIAPEEVPGDSGSTAPDTAAVSGSTVSEEPESATAGAGKTDGPGAIEGDAAAAQETAEAEPTATTDGDAPASPGDTDDSAPEGAAADETVAEAEPASRPSGSEKDAAAAQEMTAADSTASIDGDTPGSPDDTGVTHGDGTAVGETVTDREPAGGPGGSDEDAAAAQEMAEALSMAPSDGDAPGSAGDTGVTDGEGTAVGETVADREPAGGPGGSDEDAAAAQEMAEALSMAPSDGDAPVSPDDTGGGGERGALAGETAAGSEPISGQAGADAKVMAALSRAAEATGEPRSETAKAGAGTDTEGDARGEAAADAGAATGADGYGDGASAASGTAQTGAEGGVTGPAAEAPGHGQAGTGTVTGTRATDEGAGATGPYFSGRDYTVRSGDTLWDLADRRYVNPYYWPHIWNHNTDITNPNLIVVGQGLWLPKLEGDPQSLTEADRRSIAEGYLRLYRFFREQGVGNPKHALVGVRYFDASVLPGRLRGTAVDPPGDTLAAAFQARLEAEFPLD